MRPTFVILTGGRSTRFGSDKSSASLGDATLLNHLLATLPENSEIFIVGPPENNLVRSAVFIEEEILYGGPLSAIASALPHIKSERIAIIATDMPLAGIFLASLFELDMFEFDAIIPRDESGFDQPLCAIYRTRALRSAIKSLGSPVDKSIKLLLRELNSQSYLINHQEQSRLRDVDTPQDLILIKQTHKIDLPKNSPEKREIMLEWIAAVKKELAISGEVDIDTLLLLARDAAHNVERPSAPITTYLLGIAVAQGQDVVEASKKISFLAKNWKSEA